MQVEHCTSGWKLSTNQAQILFDTSYAYSRIRSFRKNMPVLIVQEIEVYRSWNVLCQPINDITVPVLTIYHGTEVFLSRCSLLMMKMAFRLMIDMDTCGKWFGSPDFSLYYPMQVRYTAIIVPPGGGEPVWDSISHYYHSILQIRPIEVGKTATFSVVATGTEPLFYQWQKNGVNISGAYSSSYTTPPLTMG